MTIERQRRVLNWIIETFGVSTCCKNERAARLVEEAIEVAQSVGLAPEIVNLITDRVYSRPPGKLYQEISGVAITLDAMAEVVGLSVDEEAEREMERVLSLSKDHFKEKHAIKVAAGIADLT